MPRRIKPLIARRHIRIYNKLVHARRSEKTAFYEFAAQARQTTDRVLKAELKAKMASAKMKRESYGVVIKNLIEFRSHPDVAFEEAIIREQIESEREMALEEALLRDLIRNDMFLEE